MKENTQFKKESNFNPEDNIQTIVKDVANILREGKTFDIIVLDLDDLTSITDYFIICTASSSVQIKAIIRDIEEYLRKKGLKLINLVDNLNSPWVLLDYNYFVVHIFLKEGREFYQIERLWSDAKVLYNSNKEKER